MKSQDRALRVKIYFVMGSFAAMILILMARGFQHQVINRDRYLRWAREQQLQPVRLIPLRGRVLDSRGTPLAASLKAASLFAHPARVQDPDATAEALARALGLEAWELREKLRQPISFVWLARQLPLEQAAAVERLQLAGIGLEREGRRYYPLRELAANVIGFAGVDSQGLEGVEWFYEKQLKGKQGTLLLLQDARGRALWQEVYQDSREEDVNEIVLTLDARMQFFVEAALREAVEETGAAGGQVVVLQPASGEILAMACMPTFNPNEFHAYPGASWRNRALTDAFEAGSTIKPFMLAAVLEEGVVEEQTQFDCESGRYYFGGHLIHDVHPYDVLSVKDIVVKSSNIGTTKVAEQLGSPALWKYLHAFGFGRKTNVDLPGEATGTLRHWKTWTKICLANHAFGQGFSVTALQLATAYGAIANGGFLVEPHVVREIRDEKGNVIERREPRVKGRAISKRTSDRVLAVLESAVQEGTGKRAQVPGVRVGGKTGTAQKFEPDTMQYSDSKRVCSFVAVVPIEKPEMVVVVALDEPGGRVTGGMVAAPVFQKLASAALMYREVQAREPDPEPALAPAAQAPASEPVIRTASLHGTDVTAAGESAAAGAWIMPDLKELSVRSALTELQALPVRIEIEGSGVVAEQEPAAGSALEEGQTVRLRAGSGEAEG
ncbi:MAG: penicillin-binding protein [bacterium]